jgi:hypothetical protein
MLTIPVEKIRPAQVLLVHRKGLLSWFIRRVTHSKWNHSALIEGARHGDTLYTIEAYDLQGVRHCALQDYCEDPEVRGLAIYDDPTLTMEERWAICEYAEGLNARPYDTLQLLGIYLRLRIPFLRPNQNRLDSTDALICSELVGRSYREVKRDLCPPGVGMGCLAPGDLPQRLTLVWEGWR